MLNKIFGQFFCTFLHLISTLTLCELYLASPYFTVKNNKTNRLFRNQKKFFRKKYGK